MLGGKCLIMNEVFDPLAGYGDITFSTPHDLHILYANKPRMAIGNQKVNLSTWWLNQPNRRQYEGIVLAPGKSIAGYYNLWQGFAVKPIQGNCSLYLNHVRENICQDDLELNNYVIGWMAIAVQQPDKRPGTAIVLRGRQGTGKGVAITEFGKLFGKHFVHVQHPRHLTGHFNAHLKNALLVFADEAFWVGNKSAEGALKAMITEEYMPIEFKGKDVLHIKNNIRVMIASNHDWIVPAGLEERRFLVLDVSDIHMQDHDYFEDISHQLNNGGREALLHYLLNYDISDINLKKLPQTNALREQKILSMNTVQRFWYDRLMEGSLNPLNSYWEGKILCDRFQEIYINTMRQEGQIRKASETQLGIALRKICPKMIKERKMHNGERPYYYIFPSLEECRKTFDDIMGCKNPWPVD